MASRARPSGLQAAVLAHKERQEEKVEEVVAMGGTVAWEAGGETGGSSTELELLLCFFDYRLHILLQLCLHLCSATWPPFSQAERRPPHSSGKLDF